MDDLPNPQVNDRQRPVPEPTEAPLQPHHASDPFRPELPDPVYWVTPRHLAGDDHALAERIGDALAGLGWRMWPTSRHTLLYVSPDGLCGAEWILAAYPFDLGGLPVDGVEHVLHSRRPVRGAR